MIENEMTVSVPLEVVKASEIEPKEVKWLWYPYIPFGKVTLLQGDPGDGKSKLMLSIAALLSKGEPLPFTETEENEPMTIIYQTTEDDADDTVVPRFNSAGGNGENLIFIKEDEKSLSFGDNRIREAIEMYHAKLLILDPMSSYIGESCSMNNANETRAEFNHLIVVAKDTGCAIVIIAHMNKMRDTNPLYRTNGSIDIAGAARSILAITRTPNKEAPAERYLVQVKSNLAPTGSAILFEVSEKSVDFISEMEMTAEEAFQSLAPKIGRPNDKEVKAKAFLIEMLKDGEMLSSDCEEKLEAAGFRKSTIKKAMLCSLVLGRNRHNIYQAVAGTEMLEIFDLRFFSLTDYINDGPTFATACFIWVVFFPHSCHKPSPPINGIAPKRPCKYPLRMFSPFLGEKDASEYSSVAQDRSSFSANQI